MNIESFISQTELFADASPALKKSISAKVKVMTYERGDFIFNEGDTGNLFYILESGFVRLVKNSFDGKEIMVRLVKDKETFGEVILFESSIYPVTAIAGDTTRLLALRKSDFNEILSELDMRNEFCGMLMRRLRYLTERVLYVSAFDVEERFFRFLADRYGKQYEYTVSMQKKDIASSIGTIPETMSRLIQRLKNRGIITWEGDNLSLQKGFWDSVDYE